MWDIIKILPKTFIPLFVAIDVFAVLPIFISLTSGFTLKEKRTVIRQSIVTALIVGLVFAAIGEAVFKILGITVDDFKIAGGLILLVIAILDLTQEGKERRRPGGTVGIVPLGVPLIVGPAVLTTLIVLIGHYGLVPTLIALVLNFFVVWVTFIKAATIIQSFGKNGILAISKVMALLLAAIAVMMIRLGIEGIVR